MKIRVISYNESTHTLVALTMPGGTKEIVVDPFVGCAWDDDDAEREREIARASVGKFYQMPDDVYISTACGIACICPSEGQMWDAHP